VTENLFRVVTDTPTEFRSAAPPQVPTESLLGVGGFEERDHARNLLALRCSHRPISFLSKKSCVLKFFVARI
jgi:hypothetical protein